MAHDTTEGAPAGVDLFESSLSHIPGDLVEAARVVFGERTGDVMEPLLVMAQAAGSRLVGQVIEGEPGGQLKLVTGELTRDGGLVVRNHYGQGACTDRCLCYRLDRESIVDLNPRSLGFLFGQPEPEEQFKVGIRNARTQLQSLNEAQGLVDPLSVYTASERWRSYFIGHTLGEAIAEAMQQVLQVIDNEHERRYAA